MRALSLFASLWALVAGTANGFAAAPETAALQAEIDRLAAAGGGTLIVSTRILCAHATEDDIVPIASSRNFLDNWTVAGNEGEFYACSEKREPNLGGHRIWRRFDEPHRLLAHLEAKILRFLKRGRR